MYCGFVPNSVVGIHLQNNGQKKEKQEGKLSVMFRCHHLFSNRSDKGESLHFPLKKAPGFVEVCHLLFH